MLISVWNLFILFVSVSKSVRVCYGGFVSGSGRWRTAGTGGIGIRVRAGGEGVGSAGKQGGICWSLWGKLSVGISGISRVWLDMFYLWFIDLPITVIIVISQPIPWWLLVRVAQEPAYLLELVGFSETLAFLQYIIINKPLYIHNIHIYTSLIYICIY